MNLPASRTSQTLTYICARTILYKEEEEEETILEDDDKVLNAILVPFDEKQHFFLLLREDSYCEARRFWRDSNCVRAFNAARR